LNREEDKNFNSYDNKHTLEQLKTLQSMTLGEKVGVTQARLMEWYLRNDKKCYVSFSGGKDSTVLAYIAAQVCDMFHCKLVLWFSDTGLEFPELREHVKTYGDFLKKEFEGLDVETIIEYPRDRKGKRILFKDVVLNYGYPIISKRISGYVNSAKNDQTCTRAKYLSGEIENTLFGGNGKWWFLVDAPFKISDYCCTKLKKTPNKNFAKRTGLKPIFGTMTEESVNRKLNWIKYGCNAFEGKEQRSQPMSFWTEQNVLEYIATYHLPYPSVYGEIKQDETGKWYTTGYKRTGCIFCGYGCHLEKEPNRFQMLKKTHPELWYFCMKPVSDGGLGMREVLEYIGVKIE
jgi:3'-phosphoadenosine 5'-phosphosulfate sulfotransferase (PAPS reductase)/FAD synthetase